MKRIGFTGTRNGMTRQQHAALCCWMHDVVGPCEVTHGRCVGADEEMHAIAQGLGWRIVLRPGLNPPHLIAECAGADKIWPPKNNLVRNEEIVQSTEIVLAAPDGPERLRSGTWSTVRKARNWQREIHIFMPDGSVRYEAGYTHGSDDLV